MTQIYEYYNTGKDGAIDINAQHAAQTFTVGGSQHTVTSVKLMLYRSGSPGLVTVQIRTASGNLPTATVLTSGTYDGNSVTTDSAGAWYEIAITTYTLAASTQYAIVVSSAAATLKWCHDATSPTYTGGQASYSTTPWTTWNALSSRDMMFEVWGSPPVSIPTVTTQAATSIGLD